VPAFHGLLLSVGEVHKIENFQFLSNV
jgi:hypothetical protein